MTTSNTAKTTRLSYKDFTLQAIARLKTPGYDGIHVVFSGFNTAFRAYYAEEPKAHLDKLVADKVIRLVPVRKGALIFDNSKPAPGTPAKASKPATNPTLDKILGKKS